MNNEQYQRTRQWNRWQVGDRVIFKGDGFVYKVLSRLLGGTWGWHMATLVEKDEVGWWLLDSTGSGVGKKRFIINGFICEDYDRPFRLYHWHDKTPDKNKVARFIKERENEPYDYDAYLGTILSEILTRVFRRPFRVVDRQKHCWELAEEFDDVMGKPWCERYQYPKITMFTEQAGNPYYEYK